MGGKGSGRPRKPLKEVVNELQEDVRELNDDVLALHKKVNRVTARWNYWLKEVEKK